MNNCTNNSNNIEERRGCLLQKIRFIFLFMLTITLVFVSFPLFEVSAEKEKEKEKDKLNLPKNVLSIMKTNTFPNPSEEMTVVEPSPFTKQLLEELDRPIENPEIVKLLNESLVKTTPFTLGYHAEIFLGRWPLYYDSQNSSVIWDYQLINENELNNRNSNEVAEIRYLQQKDYEVKGALMNKVEHPEMIKRLMLQKTKSKSSLPLSFSTKVGKNTKLTNFYNVPAKKKGILKVYVPAINEKGKIIYGDVFLQSKGTSVSLEIKNITKHGVGAWIPIQDHVFFSYTTH